MGAPGTPTTPTPAEPEADPDPPAGAVAAKEPSEPAPPPEDPALDTIRAGTFDSGKMWTFEYPPLDYLRETYGFEADEAWFRHARLGALRIPGCTASFVSPRGLVATNNHCAREDIEAVSLEGEDLLTDGFYAESMEDERPVEESWADQLIEIRDVTDQVYAGLEGIEDARERLQRRDELLQEISDGILEESGGEDSGYLVEMVSLWAGARYSAYIFRHYTDLRLVMAPEHQIASFGGDWDNFTYPRYDLDVTFYRVYGDDGEPVEPEFYFPFSEEGVEEGDLIFVVGNPGSTSRLQTVAELEYRRDVSDRALVELLRSRIPILHEFSEEHPEEAREMELRTTILSFENSLKAYTGIVEGLHDPVILAKRRDYQRQLQEAIEADPELDPEYGDLIDRMVEIKARQREYAAENASFLAVGHDVLGSATLGRGLAAFQYLSAQRQGAPDQMVEGLREALVSTADQPRALNEANLVERFRDIQRNFGPDDPFTQQLLQGRTPEGAAAVLMSRSALVDSASTVRAVEEGTLTPEDPAIQLAQALVQKVGPAQMAQQDIGPATEEIANGLGRALFEIYGTELPPDATFSLRITDGVVAKYEYNGTIAPVYTTFYGLYDHYYSYGPDTFWDLPERWLSPPEDFDLSTPVNFVSTADIIGGNSGSPVLNRELEVVGLAFDGNIESLPGDYIFLPDENRCVAVDSRGILEALRDMYGAQRLVRELEEAQPVR